MGLLSKEQLDARRISIEFLSFDKDLGLCTTKKDSSGKLILTAVPGVEGYLMGFNSHEYEFKGKMQKKFDIFLQDNEFSKRFIQLQFGMYSWQTWILLNKLLSVRDGIVRGEEVTISCANRTGCEFYDFFIELSGKHLKQKFSRARDNESLKFKEKGNTEDNEKIRNRHIDAWFSKILEVLPFDKEQMQIAGQTNINTEPVNTSQEDNEEDINAPY